jgi:putative hemolysin
MSIDVSDNLDVNEQTVFLKLPSLIRGYLKLGAVVCGPPALDGQFDTGDFSSVVRRS